MASCCVTICARTCSWISMSGTPAARSSSASSLRLAPTKKNVGERWSMVTCSQSYAMFGINVAAVAPEPITTTRLPARSTSSGHSCGWMHLALERVEVRPLGRVALTVLVVALAHVDEAGGDGVLRPLDRAHRDGPTTIVGRPARRLDAGVVANVRREVVLLDHLAHVMEDLVARSDRRLAPRLELVAEGEQVAVGAHARVAVRPPRPAETVERLDDQEGLVGLLVSEMAGTADAGDAGADDEDVEVLWFHRLSMAGVVR